MNKISKTCLKNSSRALTASSLKGVFNPITIPFVHQDTYGINELHVEALRNNMRYWMDSDLTGHVILGSTGEFPSLNVHEKQVILEEVAKERDSYDPEKILIAGTGDYGCLDTVHHLSKYAEEVGYGAVMVVPPHYYLPVFRNNVDLINDFFLFLADELSIPLILYTIPQFVGYEIPPACVEVLSGHPNIIGMKDSAGDKDLLGQYVEAAKPNEDDFSVLSGSGPLLLDMLEIGAAGGINAVSNIVPNETFGVFSEFSKNRKQEAQILQEMVATVNNECNALASVSGIGGLKTAMDMGSKLYGGPCRPPLPQVASPEDARLLKTILRELKVDVIT